MAIGKSVKKSVTKEAKKTLAVSKKFAGRSVITSTEKATRKAVKKVSKTNVKKVVKKPVSNTAKKTVRKVKEKNIQAIRKKVLNSSVKSAHVKKADRRVKRTAVEAEYRIPSSDPVNRRLVEDLVAFLDEKKLTDIKVMNLEDVNPYFCFFIIATARSPLHLGTTVREISRRFGEHLTDKKIRPLDVESGWVIHDFVDVVLHVFLQEQRDYYNLEKLWGDAPVIYSAEAPRFQWPR